MKKLLLLLCITAFEKSFAQSIDAIINVSEVERIEKTLADDGMQGRRAGTPSSDLAALFIAAEFKKAGLQPVSGNSYLQEFVMLRPRFLEVKGEMDDKDLNPDDIIVFTSERELKINEKSGYSFEYIRAGENFGQRAQSIIRSNGNYVVFVDPSFSANFQRLTGLKRQLFKRKTSVAFVLGTYQPKEFNIKAEHSFEETKFTNVVGVLPGTARREEQVVFSAHYDHIGIGRALDGDSIYNGANDDAAGTTGVILLANYFARKKDNARTLVFAAFTAEEIGGFGSQYFSQQLDPVKVVAMFNLEMIGTESKWGKNSAYITGFEKTDMGAILQKNLQGSAFSFYPDPYTKENLFYRSDNATLARLGVPAHTISTSKMDNEPNYHKASDEVETLDLANMTEIIKAIAVSAGTIISGKDTPTRVNLQTVN